MNILEQEQLHHKYKEQILCNLYNNINYKLFFNKLDKANIKYYLFNSNNHITKLFNTETEITLDNFLTKLDHPIPDRFSGAEIKQISYYGIHFIHDNLTIGFRNDYSIEIYPALEQILLELQDEKTNR